MPVYGYRCTHGHHFEVQQRITEPPLTQCPECGAPVTRVFYPVGIIFKGGGFYKTDSRGSSSDGSITPAEPPKVDSKPDGKADTKTKAAPESGSSTPSVTPPAKTDNKTSTKEGAA
ncbi:MAG TPA: FmdB family zinc ribbon protein [Candidatus Dormibacteraeota bacterium]